MARRLIRVLVVEDDEEDFVLARRLLSQSRDETFEVFRAERLSEALQRMADVSFDTVLLDLSLPDSSGLDTFAALHARFPDMPVVLLTGLHDESLGTRAVKAGAQDYLTKSDLTTGLLTRSISYGIERRRSQDALQAAYRELEALVNHRTRELAQSHQRLQIEVARRERAEKALKESRHLEAVCAFVDSAASRFAGILRGISERAASVGSHEDSTVPTREHCAGIIHEAGRAADLSSRLLSMAKVMGSGDTRPEAVTIASLLREAMQEFEPRLAEAGIVARGEYGAALPPVHADPAQFLDIVRHVLRHAPDVLADGGEVVVRAVPSPSGPEGDGDAGPFVMVEMLFAGQCMQEALTDRLFNPMAVPSAPATEMPSGLGAAMVNGRARSWGGAMEIVENSARGGGVRLYLRAVEQGRTATGPGSRAESGGTVLVVDDDNGFLDMSRTVLEKAGYDVICAATGAEGLAALDVAPGIAAAVLDVMMPPPGGVDLCAAFQREQPGTPVVVTSGFSRDYVQSILPGGGWRFLQKPVDADALLRTMGAVLRVECGGATPGA